MKLVKMEMVKSVGLVLLAVSGVSLSGCNYEHSKGGSGGTLSQRQYDLGGYDQIREEILKPKCLECHAAKESPQLLTYEAVVENIRAIETEVIKDGSMPPTGALSAELQSLLKSWIDAGMPREGKSDPGKVPDPTPSAEPSPVPSMEPSPVPSMEPEIVRPVTFNFLKDNVLQGKCLKCHATGNRGGITPLDTFESTMSVDKLILPLTMGRVGDVVTDPADMMPPKKATQLNDREKLILLLWYNDGNKNDGKKKDEATTK